MKNRLLTCVVFLLLIVCSCKKDPTPGMYRGRVRLVTGTHNPQNDFTTTATFSYDGQGRVTSYSGSWGAYTNAGEYVTYEYSLDSIRIRLAKPGEATRWQTLFLNEERLADSIIYDGGASSESLMYDSEGHLVKKLTYGLDHKVSSMILFVVEGGNTILSTRYTVGGNGVAADTEIVSYVYDLNHVNSASNEEFGMSFMGKSNNNPVIKETVTSVSGKTDREYVYSYDWKGKIKTMKYNISSQEFDEVSYSYY